MTDYNDRSLDAQISAIHVRMDVQDKALDRLIGGQAAASAQLSAILAHGAHRDAEMAEIKESGRATASHVKAMDERLKQLERISPETFDKRLRALEGLKKYALGFYAGATFFVGLLFKMAWEWVKARYHLGG